MKKILIVLLLITAKPAFSQETSVVLQPLDKMKLNGPFIEKTWRGYKSQDLVVNVSDNNNKKTQDNMPVVKLSDKQTLLFNNGKGSNVYSSSIDNMRILKPGSTFSSMMPVKK